MVEKAFFKNDYITAFIVFILKQLEVLLIREEYKTFENMRVEMCLKMILTLYIFKRGSLLGGF